MEEQEAKQQLRKKLLGAWGGVCVVRGANYLGRFSPPIPNIRQVFVFKTCDSGNRCHLRCLQNEPPSAGLPLFF